MPNNDIDDAHNILIGQRNMTPMSTTLASLSAELYELPPSQLNLRLRMFWLSLTPSRHCRWRSSFRTRSSGQRAWP
ncbi:hypothetical protein BV22DRAFT_1036564 [Leucogyrophana mollusca]|uniref:Uncharacterized protein n=1 Tax=Leucogyrophana mollusca TaxID=85980 RepID=A0ACB8BCK2_9AGAM|nr:hypothetical protein BV22DRAFT_1036564 [Leucogyrophana mollusca]